MSAIASINATIWYFNLIYTINSIIKLYNFFYLNNIIILLNSDNIQTWIIMNKWTLLEENLHNVQILISTKISIIEYTLLYMKLFLSTDNLF